MRVFLLLLLLLLLAADQVRGALVESVYLLSHVPAGYGVSTGSNSFGLHFTCNVASMLTAVRLYHTAGNTGANVHVWRVAPGFVSAVANGTYANTAAGSATPGWVDILVDPPTNLLAGQIYTVSWDCVGDWYELNNPVYETTTMFQQTIYGASSAGYSVGPSGAWTNGQTGSQVGYYISPVVTAYTYALPAALYPDGGGVVDASFALSHVPGGTTGTATVTFGMHFTATVNSWLLAVRFYHRSGNTGSHVYVFCVNSGLTAATLNGTYASTVAGLPVTGWVEMAVEPAMPLVAGSTYTVAIESIGSFPEQANPVYNTTTMYQPALVLGSSGGFSGSIGTWPAGTGGVPTTYFVTPVVNLTERYVAPEPSSTAPAGPSSTAPEGPSSTAPAGPSSTAPVGPSSTAPAAQSSTAPAMQSSTAPAAHSSTGMASSTGAGSGPPAFPTDLSLQLIGLSPSATAEEVGLAVVTEAALVTGLSPLTFVVRSVVLSGDGAAVVIVRVPLGTAHVLEQFVSSGPDGMVYPIFAHSSVADIAIVVEPDAPLPYIPFDASGCNCHGVGTCYGGVCGCTPTSEEVGQCVAGSTPFVPRADQICVSRASNPTPSPDLCVSNSSTADALMYQPETCEQRMGSRSRNLFAPHRLFCQSLDYSVGVDRFTFSGILGDPANDTASVFTFRSPFANLAALVVAGIDHNTTVVTTGVYLSNIYPLGAAPTLSQFWVQIEFDSLYSSALNGTSGVVVLLKRVTGRDTIEGAPNYYWHNNTWNAWVTGVLPPSAYAYWDPALAAPSWACFRNHIFDAALDVCLPACDNGFAGVECATPIDGDTCVVRAWNSTSMVYVGQACDRVKCQPGYEQVWGDCAVPAADEVVIVVVVPEEEDKAATTEITTLTIVAIVISVAAVIGIVGFGVAWLAAKSSAATAAAAAGTGNRARIHQARPTVRPSSGTFVNLEMARY